jgi:NAD(P)H dehydrogenase (quinone)
LSPATIVEIDQRNLMTIVVTGATGHLGHLIVEALLRDGVAPSEIVAGGRNLAKLDDLASRGVRVARLDYDDPATLTAALEGADTLMLVSASEPGKRVPQHRAAIDAAVAAGVKRIVYTSAPKATTSALVLAPEHKETEELIVASGIPSTILQNGWYTENYTGSATQAAESGSLVSSAGDGRVSSASRRDYADAAAVVLTTEGHEGKVYELSGDVAWSQADLADAISKATGKPVTYKPVTTAEHAEILTSAGLDEGTVGFVTALDANIRDGLIGYTTGDLSRLIGRPTTPLLEGLRASL